MHNKEFMPRNKKHRHCRRLGGRKGFKPIGEPARTLTETVLSLDEFEAMRLCDLEGKSQLDAAASLGVSRGTVQRLLNSGRVKIMDALLHGKVLNISESYSAD
jgi:predicted DNA-binding protein (UPF0251 family)